MILTCPACDTKYVVKDDAIPAGGRQVRCASCKHSWHQEPEGAVVEAESVAINFEAHAEEEVAEAPLAEAPQQAVEEGMIAGEPQPHVPEEARSEWQQPPAAAHNQPDAADDVSMEEAPAVADEWRPPEQPIGAAFPADEPAAVEEPVAEAEEPSSPAEEEFVGYAPIAVDEEESRRRWPLILAILLLIAGAAAAFWFLAPPEWKARAGIAQAGATPLQLKITNADRQPLESGNELVAISGEVINPTNEAQNMPPIRAELRDKQTRAVVHRWTIDPPARVLAPLSSASFNSAEIDVPKGGDELSVTLEQAGS
jgi:predicted Zn finger-like uncharacterized protein